MFTCVCACVCDRQYEKKVSQVLETHSCQKNERPLVPTFGKYFGELISHPSSVLRPGTAVTRGVTS